MFKNGGTGGNRSQEGGFYEADPRMRKSQPLARTRQTVGIDIDDNKADEEADMLDGLGPTT